MRSTALLLHRIPAPPKVVFGRNELIDTIVGLAENLTPFALVGPAGIGKTFIALAVLHHDRIKRRFGDNRWFLRCDDFPASGAHFLDRLSEVTGARIEHSSRKMIIVLDNAESILDPRGPNGREIREVVEGLSGFRNICLCLTSRISTIPPTCKRIDIPTLSMKAARDTFYSHYKSHEMSNLVNNILEQLDFHPFSITLLAITAYQNRKNINQLIEGWKSQRTGLIHNWNRCDVLAASIEFSLASPTFRGLGPNAREVLEVIAFFPQGINEDNLDWLFPTLSNRSSILNILCVLSPTYRRDGYVTMLAPFREYFRPRDTSCSPLPHVIQHRISGDYNRGEPGPEEEQWIALGKGEQLRACECYCLLGNKYYFRREKKKAIKHFKTALRIASSFDWRTQLFWIHHRLANLFFDEEDFFDADYHFECAKSYAVDDPYLLGHLTWLRAMFWYGEDRIEEQGLRPIALSMRSSSFGRRATCRTANPSSSTE